VIDKEETMTREQTIERLKELGYAGCEETGVLHLEEADLRGADLRGADLRGTDLSGARLRGADLRGTDLSGARLRGADLGEADLRWARLRGTNLGGAGLGGARLRGVDFREADLRWANLRGADLGRASFEGADLGRARLEGTDLREADFRGASLEEAGLEGAFFEGACLERARLEGADLSGASGLLSEIEWMKASFEVSQEGWIVYKAIGETHYAAPPSWKIERNAFLEEQVDSCRTVSCGCGVNFATRGWVEKRYKGGRTKIWKCLIHWEDALSIVVPYDTDGKARCARLQLVEELD
jgi:hypothetical protein